MKTRQYSNFPFVEPRQRFKTWPGRFEYRVKHGQKWGEGYWRKFPIGHKFQGNELARGIRDFTRRRKWAGDVIWRLQNVV